MLLWKIADTDTLCTLQHRRRVGTFLAHLRSEMVAAAAPEMGYPRSANDDGENLLLVAWMDERRRRRRGLRHQILDSGRAFMMLGALVLKWRRLTCCNAVHVLAGFLLWLLGAGLAMLLLVAGRFRGLAAACALSRGRSAATL
ncbi:hypothetical protein C2845_PM15G16590 [Panicum miliaceum]|uniref:Uncharacterized protein n=1 Tax=Panicum miliaceum TaxID=4540 RepID=A0A3L6Q979_PANMI|nr:hypothetical protein C2845_PM15G16590 [Panicum miliaceum]